MDLKPILTALALSAFAVACTSIPLTSLPRLQGIDPMTVDPGNIEVAVRFEDGLALEDEDVTLDFAFKNGITEERLGGTFPLEPMDGALTPFLERQADRGGTILRYTLSEEQAEQIRTARTEALTWERQAEGLHSLSFAAGAKPCLTDDANPFRSLRFSVYLRDDPEKDYFTLLNNQSVDVLQESGELNTCGTQAPE